MCGALPPEGCWEQDNSIRISAQWAIVCLPITFCSANVWLERRTGNKIELNESGFRPPLCTERLNWARRTSWKWWVGWDDTASRHRIQNLGHVATFGHWSSPQYLIFTSERGRNSFLLWTLKDTLEFEPVIFDFPSRQLYQLHQSYRPRRTET